VEAYQSQKTDVEELSPAVLQQISSTETSAGLLAVFSKPTFPFPKPLTFLVIADALRDPGNLGTLLRTVTAAGVQGIALTPTCVDVFSPKVVRAGMGAHFRMPLHNLDWDEIRSICRSQPVPLRLLLAETENAASCWQTDLRIPLALIIGSEAEGATPKAREAADGLIAIPMPGKSESLNAAVAAAILIFEVVRQRSS
jgi:TrmH family RNA methyltransferase